MQITQRHIGYASSQSLHELIRRQMEVPRIRCGRQRPSRTNRRCPPRAVVLHEGGKRRAGRWLVLTERDRKRILELVHAQLLEGLLIRSFEDGIYLITAKPTPGARSAVQPL